MKTTIFSGLICFLITFLTAGLIASQPAAAFTGTATGENIYLPQDETIDRDFFAVGNRIQIDGTINGDLYAAGNTIEINGQINGDILAAGNTINIRGNISQNARLAGNSVTLGGLIGRNLTLAVASAHLGDTASLEGSLAAAAKSLTIATPVSGDVRAYVDRLHLTATGSIGGDLAYTSLTEAEIDPPATVSGRIDRETPRRGIAEITPDQISQVFSRIGAFFTLLNSLTRLFIGLLLLALFPRLFPATTRAIQDRTGATIAVGLLVLFVLPALLGLLLITLLGLPLALIGYLLYGLSLYLAPLPVSFWVGHSLSTALNWSISPYLQFILGLLLITLLTLIPTLGWLISFIVIILGLGAYYLPLMTGLQKQVS
jgi:hypothetical protein